MTDDDPDGAEDAFVWNDADDEPGEDQPGAGREGGEMGEQRERSRTGEQSDGSETTEDAFLWDEASVGDVEGGDDGPDDAPLGGLAEEIRERRSSGSDPRSSGSDPGPAGDRSGGGTPAGPSGGGERPDLTGTTAGGEEWTRGGGDPAPSDGDESGGGADEPPSAADEPRSEADEIRSEADGSPPERGRSDAPMGGLADEVRRRRSDPTGDDAGEADERFREMAYQEIESERLWESLADEEPAGVSPSEPVDADPAAGGADGADVRIIPKRTCETCEYLSGPPEVACTHEGTDILELVGVDRHKVVNCPMVADDGE